MGLMTKGLCLNPQPLTLNPKLQIRPKTWGPNTRTLTILVHCIGWALARGFHLRCHNKETILVTIDPHHGKNHFTRTQVVGLAAATIHILPHRRKPYRRHRQRMTPHRDIAPPTLQPSPLQLSSPPTLPQPPHPPTRPLSTSQSCKLQPSTSPALHPSTLPTLQPSTPPANHSLQPWSPLQHSGGVEGWRPGGAGGLEVCSLWFTVLAYRV